MKRTCCQGAGGSPALLAWLRKCVSALTNCLLLCRGYIEKVFMFSDSVSAVVVWEKIDQRQTPPPPSGSAYSYSASHSSERGALNTSHPLTVDVCELD